MARIVIQDSSTGEIKQISDRVLPFFPGWVQVDTIDDEFPPTLFYTGAAADARYVNVAEISDPDSPGGVALRAAFGAVGRVKLQEFGSVDLTGATDHTDLINDALAELYSLGGGLIEMPIGTVWADGQIVIPNDGAALPLQPPLGFVGPGAQWTGRGVTPMGGAVLRLTADGGATGKIQTSGLGLFTAQGVTFRDPSGDASPFLYTTNTTLHVAGNAFFGSKAVTACDQDAIILGGTQQAAGAGGLDDGFQGYGTVISRNYFGGIRRAVAGQAFANGVQVTQNTVWATCGNADGAAIEWDGRPATGVEKAAGGTIGGNLIELVGYQYGIRAENTVGMSFLSNDFYDAGPIAEAGIYLPESSSSNRIVAGYMAAGTPYLRDDTGYNTYDEMNANGFSSVEPQGRVFRGQAQSIVGTGDGVWAVETNGHAAYVKATSPWAPDFPQRASIATRPAASVTDAVITEGSRTITSATANWTLTDTGAPVGVPGILYAGTYIARVVSPTEIETTLAAAASANPATLYWGRQGAEIEQLGFEGRHLVAQGNPPGITPGAAAGTGRAAAITGRDLAGTITVTTGTSTAAGTLATVLFATVHSGTAHIVLTPANEAAAALYASGVWATYLPGDAWSVSSVAAPPVSTDLAFSYVVIEAG